MKRLLITIFTLTALFAQAEETTTVKPLAKEVILNAQRVAMNRYSLTLKVGDPLFIVDGDVNAEAAPQHIFVIMEEIDEDILIFDGETYEIEAIGEGVAQIHAYSYDSAATAILTVTVVDPTKEVKTTETP